MKIDATLVLGSLLLSGILYAQSTPREALLVLSKKDRTLAVVNAKSLKAIVRIPVGNDPHESVMAPYVRSKLIGPTMILWSTGLVETITRASLGGHNTWRITHYPQDPTATKTNDYDLYDLDETTLAPLRSVMNTDEFNLELTFAEKEVVLHKTTNQDNITERISLSTTVQPEGPGLDVFVASLPLAIGYKVRYAIVDRWGGRGGTRVKNLTLSVSKRITEQTMIGRRDIYEVFIRPEDDSFRIREWVLAQGPHFPVRVEYTRDGKTYPVSKVIALISQRQS